MLISNMVNVFYSTVKACPVTTNEVLRIVDIASGFEKKINGEVEINAISSKKIREINRIYRGKDAVTDVLSFAWNETDRTNTNLGQIFISYDQIKKQAKEYGISEREEFARMLIHGLLHLVGYDHMKKEDENKMFSLQEKILCCALKD